MPLTAKGHAIFKSMEMTYGPEKAQRVLYASKNAGKITGIDSAKLDAAIAKADALCARTDALCKKLST